MLTNIRSVSLFMNPDLSFGWKQAGVGVIRRCRSEAVPIAILVDLTGDPASVLLVASDFLISSSAFLASPHITASIISALCNSFILLIHRTIIVAGLSMLVLLGVQPSKVDSTSREVACLCELFLCDKIFSWWNATSITADCGSFISRVKIGVGACG